MEGKDRFTFSEEAMRGFEEFRRRQPPPDLPPDPGRPASPRPAMAGAPGPAPADRRPHYWGHRERLRQRFLAGGHAAMPEYELLEILLFNAIPRIDVKPLAKRLIATFGDLAGVVAASEHRLLKVEGCDRRVYLQLRLVSAIAERMSRAQVMGRCAISSWDALLSYCRTAMAFRETEQFRILFLDARNTLIADEEQARGTVNHVPVYPREVAKRALELNATAIILVHNHPSGDPSPSRADVDMTAQIEEACRAIGVTLHDHVVIGRGGAVSFRAEGLI